MDYVTIRLNDAESEESYMLQVTQADANKAANDMAFATSLLNHARQHAIPNRIPDVQTLTTCASNSSIPVRNNAFGVETHISLSSTYLPTDIEDRTTGIPLTDLEEELVDDSVSSSFRWTHEAILLLLEEYRQREKDMYSGKISHKKAWEQISQVMNSKGYTATGRQCTTRVNTMKRTYKSVKDHNKRSGNNKRHWKYLDVMENLLGEKPYMTPLSTISSTGAETFKSRPSSSTSTSSLSSNGGTCSNEAPGVNICKRKVSDGAEVIEEIRKIEEERKRRHEERMEAKTKLMKKLDAILEKL